VIARRLQLAMIAAAVVALVALAAQSALSPSSDTETVAAVGTSTSSSSTVAATATTVEPGTTMPAAGTTLAVASTANGVALDPSWPKELFVLSDSVLLSGKDALPAAFPGWTITVDGRPALMVKKAVEELQAKNQPVDPVVVVALGYNSLWEKNGRNKDKWAQKFDDEADALLSTLTGLGAKKIVWVLLREPTKDTVPAKAVKELPQYSWYFPWVNERLRALQERHPEVALADWTTASNQNGITYDSIHLNPNGAKLMSDVIAKAVGA
jgi:hypothetical protein